MDMSKRESMPKLVSQANDLDCVHENGHKFCIEQCYECPICLTFLKDPLLTSCGHRFCRECILQWLKREGGCPIDGYNISMAKDLFPDNYTRREIAKQTRHCPVAECSILLPLLDLEKHISDNHKVLSVTNDNQETPTDAKAQECQLWEPPAKQVGEVEPEESWKTLLKSLYERIVLLEQSNRDQEIQITSLKTQVSRLVEENKDLRHNIPVQFCNGVCVWTMDKFQEKCMLLAQDQTMCYYSPDFTTSYEGYKFCARLKLSNQDPSYLSFLIHLKQGQFDNALEWPFSGRITFTLVHPLNADLSIKETMMSRPELDAFKQPTRELNTRGFGYSEFVLVSDVMSKGFVQRDCIVIKITVQTV